ncbi:MAG: SIS domain-containing protein [Erysipelotrichaceae bacterium]|nr:SIS domain-containing protein [Erysipelotrichaceae bacterium]
MEKTMLDYIKETPECLDRIIDRSYEHTKDLVDFYLKNDCDGIVLIASGSSYNGCLSVRHFIRHILGIDVALYTPFSFLHHELPFIGNGLFLGVSQSGCSTNTLEALKALKEKGRPVACLTGRDDCDARQIADLNVNWQVGEEKVGFVTKGVSSLACFLMCFTLELGKALGSVSENKYIHAKEQLKKTQQIQPLMLRKTEEVFERNKELFLSPKRVILLSSGPGFGVASEGALKIAETSCIDAFAYEAEEFLHGPIYPSSEDDLFIIIDNSDASSSSRMIDIALALQDISPRVFVLSNDERFPEEKRFSLPETTCQYTSVLYKLTCVQTLSYLMTMHSNRFEPRECVKTFKRANKVASKSREGLYLDLQKIE